MKYIILACTSLLLAACDFEVYRYACQDPNNWGSEECQKPQCEVSRTCPEHIFKDDNVFKNAEHPGAPGSLAPRITPKQGGCK